MFGKLIKRMRKQWIPGSLPAHRKPGYEATFGRPDFLFLLGCSQSLIIVPLYATMVEKAVFGSATFVPTEKVISDSELCALKVYPKDVNVSAEDVDANVTPGYVYVIQESIEGEATGCYKVGMSGDPYKRRSDLQTGNVRRLDFTRADEVTDMRSAEDAAQKALTEEGYSVDLGGGKEWFFADHRRQQAFYEIYDKEVAPYLLRAR